MRSMRIGRIVATLGSVLMLARPAAAGEGLLDDGFEAFTGVPASAARQVSDSELDGMRGRFFDLFFAVTFSAFVDAEGGVDSRLDVDVDFLGQNGQLTFENPDGTPANVEGGSVAGDSVVVRDTGTNAAFLVQAGIGNAFQGASGAFQISQVPGNGNTIVTVLDIDVVILEATQQNIDALRGRLLSLERR